MGVVQRKSQSTTIIEVLGRPGMRKGKLELTPGNVNYSRPGAKSITTSLSYQQLFALLEKEIEYQSLDTVKVKFPKPSPSGDFTLEVFEIDECDDSCSLLHASSSVNKIDPRRVDLGSYQFSNDMANGRPSKKYQWYANVSIQAALWIINRYIDKFLVSKKMSNYTDEDVVVSKQKMREVLLMLVKKIDT